MIKTSNRFIISAVVCSLVTLAAAPSLAGIKYISKGGKLVVQYGNTCSTVNPSGSYRFSDGTAGVLTALDCTNTGGDIAAHTFRDTSGKERCYGRMTQYWGQRVMTVWEVDGAVSGYRCSVVGKKFEVEMDGGQQN